MCKVLRARFVPKLKFERLEFLKVVGTLDFEWFIS